MRNLLFAALIITLFSGCTPQGDSSPTGIHYVYFRMHIDSTQAHVNNQGVGTNIVAGHAAQSPTSVSIRQTYIELVPNAYTAYGKGIVLYRAPETAIGGTSAVDFDQLKDIKDDSVFFKVPIREILEGTYQYLRIGFAYQNFEVKMLLDSTINGAAVNQEFPCNISSFLGLNTYITKYPLHSQSVTVNANEVQGYWGGEAYGAANGTAINLLKGGQVALGATTMPNPISSTAPTPAKSGIITARIYAGAGGLSIPIRESKDIYLEVYISTNKSFEWKEVVNDGKWEPGKGETVTDMGIRGVHPVVE